jgi:hypothetical protein
MIGEIDDVGTWVRASRIADESLKSTLSSHSAVLVLALDSKCIEHQYSFLVSSFVERHTMDETSQVDVRHSALWNFLRNRFSCCSPWLPNNETFYEYVQQAGNLKKYIITLNGRM